MTETVGTYEVDSAMLGTGGTAELRSFCRILQRLTEIEIVCITDSHNGARCSTPEVEELIEEPWALALDLWALTDEITAEITAENEKLTAKIEELTAESERFQRVIWRDREGSGQEFGKISTRNR